MLRSQCLAVALQRRAQQRLRLAEAALRLVELGQVVHAAQRVGMLRPQRLAVALQCLAQQRLRLAEAALHSVECG